MRHIYDHPTVYLKMSSDPTAPLAAPLPPSDVPPSLPLPDDLTPSAPLKPLLNPLQNGTPPVSTIVEPPRSPNPQNTATDNVGNNTELDLPSASTSVVGPGEVLGDQASATTASYSSAEASAPVVEASFPAPIDSNQPSLALPPAEAPISREDTAPPPLPTDAPAPPTPPQPVDEPQPTLPADVIPPAVSTPTVITTETPAAPEPTPVPEAVLPSSQPTLEPVQSTSQTNGELPSSIPPTPSAVPGLDEAFAPAVISQPNPSPKPAPSTQPAVTESSTQDAMDIDPPAYSSPAGIDSRASEVSLKRAADDDLEGRDEKRIKEEAAAQPAALTQPPAPPVEIAAPAPVQPLAPVENKPAPPVIPGLILDPNGPPPPWVTYVQPPARYPGPVSPLTPTQHKHLLAAVRSLKKNKDAFGFLGPVDVIKFGIPHYAQIVTSPMDLSTVETKLIVSDPRGPPKDKSKMKNWDESKGRYENVSQVVQDVRQIWENTRMFNGPDHVVSLMASKLDDAFEKAVKNLPAEVSPEFPGRDYSSS